MIRRLLAATACVTLLAGPASAKAPIDAAICGADGCREIPGEGTGAELVRALVLAGQSTAVAPAPGLAPYYRVELTSPGVEFAPLHVVPSARVTERNRSWIRLGARAVSAFEGVVAGLEPLPRPQLERALVNGRPSGSPGVYEGLLGALARAEAAPAGTPRAEIRLETGEPSPWTDGTGTVLYYPTLDVLRRAGEWVAVPAELADRIESDLAAVRKREDGASTPALASSALLLAGLGGVVWMTIVRRRGSSRRPRRG